MKTLKDRVSWLVEVHHDGNISNAAKRIGIPQPSLSRIINGRVINPRSDALQRMAEAYGVSVDWLLTGKGDGPRDDVPAIVESVVSLSEVAKSQYLRWALALSRLPLDPKVRAILESLPFIVPAFRFQFDERGKSEREVGKVVRRIQDIGNEFLAMTVITAASSWTALLENLSDVLGAELLADTLTAQIGDLILRDAAFLEWLRDRGELPADLPSRYDEYFAEKTSAASKRSPKNKSKGE